ncbi:MAG TPA: serine hydrolase [Cytophagales bacterium]|nr:serine hydrolase [Cytophagales bacterium]
MRITKGRIFLLVLIVVLSIGLYYGIQAGKIATSYFAKIACSCTMVSNRPIESVLEEDLSKYSFIKAEVNREEKSVNASLYGLINSKAIFRKGLGCTLVNGYTEEEIRNQVKEKNLLSPYDNSLLGWAKEDFEVTIPTEFDSAKLTEAVEKAFTENDPEKIKRSRAIVVVYKGKIIAEKYGKGIDKETPLLGWSMTKSVINALVGVLVKDGKIDINDKAPIDEWQGDSRREITLDQMLRMSSGLEFKEVYNVVADATKMLFISPEAAKVAINQPLIDSPDSIWSYSSGTTNIISSIIKKTLNTSQTDYFNFPRKVLFNRIGMTSAIMEPDPSGTFVGSSFMYATARDWARFGLLYLNDGVWEGERILPKEWVKYSSTPTPKAPMGQYGAHFWLNAGENKEGENRKWQYLPKDMYHAAGFEGQNVVIIPSRDLIIVRLGNTQSRDAWDIGVLVKDILEAQNQ